MGDQIISGKGEKLILFTSNYPNTNGEAFVENEIRVLEHYFSQIIIICATQKVKGVNRYIPENASVFVFDENISFFQKLRGIPFLFKKIFRQEIAFAKKNLGIDFKSIQYKILYIDLIKGYLLSKYTQKICNIGNNNSVYYYSYWSDYKAVACSFIKKDQPRVKALARNHGWDIYFYVHTAKYLPLRKFIFDHLDAIFCISQYGVDYLKKVLKFPHHNFFVSKLGTFNGNPLNEITLNSDSLVMVSCSNLIPIKRIELIIDALSLITNIPIKWLHFGEGVLKESLIERANKKIDPPQVSFEFKGQTTNEDILEFYKTNKVDFLINVSESEGIPVSMMEAMSYGIPVIATQVGGSGEIVKQGVNGFLLSPNPTPEEIAEKITFYYHLSAAEKESLRHNAHKTWNEEYNAERNYVAFAEKILSL